MLGAPMTNTHYTSSHRKVNHTWDSSNQTPYTQSHESTTHPPTHPPTDKCGFNPSTLIVVQRKTKTRVVMTRRAALTLLHERRYFSSTALVSRCSLAARATCEV